MNELTICGGNRGLTMSSREIAELTGKRHDHVMVDIRKMFGDLEIHSPEFSGHYKDGRGRLQDEFRLPKDLTFTPALSYLGLIINSHKSRKLASDR